MRPSDADSRSHVLSLLARHGWNSTSFQVLEPGLHYWLCEDACVAYAQVPGGRVVAGAPIASEERLGEVARCFEAAAAEYGDRVCYFAVERRFLSHHGLSAMMIGEQPVWDPQRWRHTVASSVSLRSQLRRAEARGVRARRVAADELTAPALRGAVQDLTERWLATRRMAPMTFLVQVQPFSFARERRYFAAERDGELLGLLVGVPVYARGGWLFEDLLRHERTPNGTSELLIDLALRTVREEGSRYATLGLAPLTGPVPPALRWAGRLTRGLYDFDGVRRFKARLLPQAWEPIYLAFPEHLGCTRALADTLRAFAGGSLPRFAVQTAKHWMRPRDRAAIQRQAPQRH